MSIASVMSCSLLIFWPLLLLLPSIFPSIRDFPNESAVHFRWPDYWSFSFSISPSSEYSGLISLKIDWLDLLAVQAKNWENVKQMAWTSLQDVVLGIYQKIRTGSFSTSLCSLNSLLAIRLLDEWFDWKRSYFVSVLWSKPFSGFQSNFITTVLTILKRSVRPQGICRHNWFPVFPHPSFALSFPPSALSSSSTAFLASLTFWDIPALELLNLLLLLLRNTFSRWYAWLNPSPSLDFYSNVIFLKSPFLWTWMYLVEF